MWLSPWRTTPQRTNASPNGGDSMRRKRRLLLRKISTAAALLERTGRGLGRRITHRGRVARWIRWTAAVANAMLPPDVRDFESLLGGWDGVWKL